MRRNFISFVLTGGIANSFFTPSVRIGSLSFMQGFHMIMSMMKGSFGCFSWLTGRGAGEGGVEFWKQ